MGVRTTDRQALNRSAGPLVLAVVAFFACYGLLLIGVAPNASATADYPFNPQLSYSTTTTAAGAHPNLTISMQRPIDHCPGELPGEAKTNLDGDGNDYTCLDSQLYQEQDMKRMTVHLPAGLVPDANAAPYCDPYQDWVDLSGGGAQEAYVWRCKNPASYVGAVDITTAGCSKAFYPDEHEIYCFHSGDQPPGVYIAGTGSVYNAAPGTPDANSGHTVPNEQGHLIILWRGTRDQNAGSYLRADVNITVRNSDQGVDAVADLPDYFFTKTRSTYDPENTVVESTLPAQPSEIDLELDGSTGADSGHPLLTNPTFCDSQSIGTDFLGYETNLIDTAVYNQDTYDIDYFPVDDAGKAISDSAPYQATGCDSVPYDPKLSFSLDNNGPDQPPAISSTVSQAQGEATTKKVTVSFPRAFKINDKNKSTFCSDVDLAAKTCPDSSKVGTVTADSPLLPIGQSLTGGVYLAGLTGDSIKISALLSGFIDLRIDANAKLGPDNSLVTTFDNLPAVPISQFNLQLQGGDKGLIKTPKVCAPQTVTSTFQSHSGKTATVAAPLNISGCAGPILDATLASKKPGAPTDLELDLHSQGTKLKSVTFIPSRRLHWGIPKRARSAKAKSTAVGKVAFTTASGELATRFRAARVRNDGVDLVALSPRGAQGTVSELSGFTANLSRTTTRQPELARLKGHKRGKATPQSDLTLSGLPQDDLTGIDLTLQSKPELFALRNPLGCKKPLNFVALATAEDGTQFAVSDRVRLRGRGC